MNDNKSIATPLYILIAAITVAFSNTAYESFYKNFSQAPECYAYTLCIQLPNTIKKTPVFCGYYKGEPLEFEQNFCIIHEAFLSNHFSLFITSPENSPQPKSDGNNVKYLERIKSKPYKLYNFNRTENDDTYSWHVEEEKDLMPLRIPDDAIILLINPEYIESITENNELSQEKTVGLTKLITLPKVVLKHTLQQEELAKASDTALLASLDLRAIHRKQEKTIKTASSGSVISMRTSA